MIHVALGPILLLIFLVTSAHPIPRKKHVEDLVDQNGQRTDVSVSHVLNIYIYNYMYIYIYRSIHNIYML